MIESQLIWTAVVECIRIEPASKRQPGRLEKRRCLVPNTLEEYKILAGPEWRLLVV